MCNQSKFSELFWGKDQQCDAVRFGAQLLEAGLYCRIAQKCAVSGVSIYVWNCSFVLRMVWVRDPCFVLSLSHVAFFLSVHKSVRTVRRCKSQSPDVSRFDIPHSHWPSSVFCRSCDRPNRSRFSEIFLGSRANVDLAPKIHVASTKLI